MAASYKKLFKLLIDREMKSKELAAKAGISPATLAKMKKDGAVVSSEVLVKICSALECTMDDIVEIVQAAGVAGVIATNTTIDYNLVDREKDAVKAIGSGGVSGKPLRSRSTEVIRYLSQKSK